MQRSIDAAGQREIAPAAENTLLLDDERLARAQAAHAATARILANVSHEFRTPLNGVIGMIGLLLDAELTPPQRKYAQIALSSAKTLLTVVNDLLDFRRIQTRTMRLQRRDFDLRAVLAEAADILRPRAAEKGLALAWRVDAEVPPLLRGDPLRLRQVLLNLAGNAVKFTTRGEVTIRASLDSQDASRATVRITVSDTGIGIPADQCDALFTPFVQGDDSLTRRYGGTGLGLPVARHLAEMMGGRIGLRSAPGQGSTFWFTAVLEKQVPRPDAEHAAAEGDASRRPPRPPVLQQELLLKHVLGDKELARTLVAGFLEDVPRRIRRLKQRLAAGEATHLRLDARAIKGAAAAIGAAALRQAAAAAEQMGNDDPLDRAAELVARLERELERLKTTLADMNWT